MPKSGRQVNGRKKRSTASIINKDTHNLDDYGCLYFDTGRSFALTEPVPHPLDLRLQILEEIALDDLIDLLGQL